jgi:hypothetical protein
LSPKEGLSNSKQSLATVNDSLLANYFFIIQKPDLIGSKTQSKGGQVDGYEQAGRSMTEFERWMGLLGDLPTAVPNSLSLAQANNEKFGTDPRH